MTAALIRNWPVAVSATTLILGAAFGYLLALLRRQHRAYNQGYSAGYRAHVRIIAEALARCARPVPPGTTRTRTLPAFDNGRDTANAQTITLPASRRKP